MANTTLVGWGRETWGSGAWNAYGPVAVTGVEEDGEVGSVTVTVDSNVTASGLEATGSVGSVTLALYVSVTGVVGTTGTTGINIWSVIDDSQTPDWVAVIN